MTHKQTPSDSACSPDIAGASTSGLSRAVFNGMTQEEFKREIAARDAVIEGLKKALTKALESMTSGTKKEAEK